MKAYLLARVSTDDQKDALPAQTIKLKDYAAKKAYDFELFEIKESAYKGDRQCFRAIVNQIDDDENYKIVVFDKIDRLTRDPTSPEYIRLVKLCEQGKLELHFPSDNIYVHKDSPASDKMRLGFGIVMSQYYSATISDNVKRRQSQMLRDGIWTGAAPIGYRYTVKDGKKWLVVDPFEANLINLTYEKYAKGTTSLKLIAKSWFADYGIKTPHSRIENILKSPFYYGQMKVKGVLYAHNYETIIDFALFEKVQAVLNGYSAKPHRWAGLPYAYRGLISCSECGCRVTFEIKKGKYIYGHCTQFKYKHNNKYINEEEFTKQFSKILDAIKIPEEIHSDLLKILEESKIDNVTRIETERSKLKSEISKYQTRLDKMYEDRLDGLLSDSLYKEKHEEFTLSQQKLKDHLQNIELFDSNRIDEYAHLLGMANKAQDLFKYGNIQQKRDIINLVLSNLLLDNEQLGWKYKKPFDLMALCNETSNWQGHTESNHDPRFWKPMY